MIKLYLRENSRVTAYHEAWVHGSKITEHWGKLGERGETQEHRRTKKMSEDANLRQILQIPLAAGYSPIASDDLATLIVEYAIEGIGAPKDIEKRHSLEERLNETLGWTGIGHCDGGSIGSGSMEVCCFVVDFETAKRVIVDDLKGTEFADFARIYDEGAPS